MVRSKLSYEQVGQNTVHWSMHAHVGTGRSSEKSPNREAGDSVNTAQVHDQALAQFGQAALMECSSLGVPAEGQGR